MTVWAFFFLPFLPSASIPFYARVRMRKRNNKLRKTKRTGKEKGFCPFFSTEGFFLGKRREKGESKTSPSVRPPFGLHKSPFSLLFPGETVSERKKGRRRDLGRKKKKEKGGGWGRLVGWVNISPASFPFVLPFFLSIRCHCKLSDHRSSRNRTTTTTESALPFRPIVIWR